MPRYFVPVFWLWPAITDLIGYIWRIVLTGYFLMAFCDVDGDLIREILKVAS